MTTQAASAIVFEADYPMPAPAERVFECLWRADHLQVWFADRVRIDPRPGGDFAFWGRSTIWSHTAQDAGQKLTSLTPGRSLSISWTVAGTPTTMDLLVAPSAEGSVLRVRHTAAGPLGGYDPRESHFVLEDLWGVWAGNLRSYLRTGRRAVWPDHTQPGTDLAVSIEIDAPRERVWKALTTPDELDRWMSRAAVVDQRPGGVYSFGWSFDGEPAGPSRLIEIDPPRRLVHDWRYKQDPTTRTEWLLDELGPRRTRVTVRQIKVVSARDRGGYANGWGKFLVALREHATA